MKCPSIFTLTTTLAFLSLVLFIKIDVKAGIQLVQRRFQSLYNIISPSGHGLPAVTDTMIKPGTTSRLTDQKVTISNGNEGIEFSPLSSVTNGALIQPIDRSTNKGISTSFFLNDISSWSFYTNNTQRLVIDGNGIISTGASLLINNAIPDGNSALRVNGVGRFDTAINLQAISDTSSFISLNRSLKYAALDPDDGISPYSTIPNTWANGKHIPVFRLRHPNTISTQPNLNTSIQRDFMIFPYQYGTAIEYNGVVECWVGEWSIHKGLHYSDAEGNGNGWGGVLWVGDDGDEGGIRATARKNLQAGGNSLYYGELSVENFSGKAHGDFRLRLPSDQNEFQFVYGGRGSNNVIAKLSNNGFLLPKVASVITLQTPEKAQIVFDNTDSLFKGYDGSQWVPLNDNAVKTGSSTRSGDGAKLVFKISHGLNAIPSYFSAIATNVDAANIAFVNADAAYLYINYKTPPVAGIDNLSFNWEVKK